MSPSPSPHAPPDRERGVKSILRFAKTDLIFEKNCLLANGVLFNSDDYTVRVHTADQKNPLIQAPKLGQTKKEKTDKKVRAQASKETRDRGVKELLAKCGFVGDLKTTKAARPIARQVFGDKNLKKFVPQELTKVDGGLELTGGESASQINSHNTFMLERFKLLLSRANQDKKMTYAELVRISAEQFLQLATTMKGDSQKGLKKWNRTKKIEQYVINNNWGEKTIYYDEVMKSLEWIDSCKPGIIREIETQIVRLPFMKEGEENKMLTAIRQFLEKDVIIKYTEKLLNRFKNK